MRNTPNVHAERYRITSGRLGSDSSLGNNGAFLILRAGGPNLFVIASDGEGWDHCSVSVKVNPRRCPTWYEMVLVKNLFFRDDETVVQFHPRKEAYVNCHEFCLHLWRKQGADTELPPAWLVGIRDERDVEDAKAALVRMLLSEEENP